MFKQTDTRWAPWVGLDANDEQACHIAALTVIAEALEKAIPQQPPERSEPPMVPAPTPPPEIEVAEGSEIEPAYAEMKDRYAMGDFTGALPKLKDQLDHAKGDDQPLLFVALQVLFRMHQQDKSLSPDNLDRFRSYVERHQKLGGPDRALVETWRRSVLGR